MLQGLTVSSHNCSHHHHPPHSSVCCRQFPCQYPSFRPLRHFRPPPPYQTLQPCHSRWILDRLVPHPRHCRILDRLVLHPRHCWILDRLVPHPRHCRVERYYPVVIRYWVHRRHFLRYSRNHYRVHRCHVLRYSRNHFLEFFGLKQ